MDRREADKELMIAGNPQGTFLVRAASGEYLYNYFTTTCLTVYDEQIVLCLKSTAVKLEITT